MDRQLIAFGRAKLDTTIIRTDSHHLLLNQPGTGSDTDTGIVRAVQAIVLATMFAPAGIKQHGITRLQRHTLLLQRLLQVGIGNFIILRQNVYALECCYVYQHTTRDQ